MTDIFNSSKCLFILSTVLLLIVHTESKTLGKIDPKLLNKYDAQPKLNIFVRFTQGTSKVLKSVTQARYPDRTELLNALNERLLENARESQQTVVNYLSQITNNPNQITSLWISNELYIRDADLDLILSLVKYPEILSIYEEEFASLVSPVSEGPIFLRQGSLQVQDEWGVQKIQSTEAINHLQAFLKTPWNQIRVATIDTGVRVTHEALRDNFLGDYGWYDPYDLTAFPNDNHGHGTHTTGTIAGKHGIGVFPNATWMACKGCASATCNQLALMECGQFITCPTLPNGSENNCALAPHIVSNSWYYRLQGFPWYNGVIEAWQTAGIIPLFSIGNEGPKCKTANSPGDQPGVIGVGSTTIDDEVSSFSSLGPAAEGWLKPDITAPGSSVISAHHTADDAYKSMSGTSMSCPHAAGLIAILLTYDPELNFDTVKQYIFDGVDTDTLKPTGKACGSDEDDRSFPNNIYGHGRINAFKSIKKLVRDSRKESLVLMD